MAAPCFNTFSCNRMRLADVGVKGIGLSSKSKNLRSFVLKTYIVGGNPANTPPIEYSLSKVKVNMLRFPS